MGGQNGSCRAFPRAFQSSIGLRRCCRNHCAAQAEKTRWRQESKEQAKRKQVAANFFADLL